MRLTLSLSLLTLIGVGTAQAQRWATLDGRPPLVIGHRGASGYLPEHTLESYLRAIELGADFVEPDLLITKDGILIARHEPLLDGTTDVASRPEFAAKKNTKLLDGIPTTGFWASDFTLDEIKRLRAVQPNGARSKEFDGRFEIPTLVEIIEMVQRESWLRRRVIGIYPETKHPTFHYALGMPLEDELLRVLARYRLDERNSPVIIQSFESGNLMYLRPKTKVRLVQLIDADDTALNGAITFAAPYDRPYNQAVLGDPRTFGDMLKPGSLEEIARYADGIGPWKPYIISWVGRDANGDGKADDVNGDGVVNNMDKTITAASDLVARAHRAGLFVHVYTFRNEPGQLAATYRGDPRTEYQLFFSLGVDGVFSDFPDTAIQGRQFAAERLPR
jgi:glycerophosphoryl diester phosphodiesterase